MFRRKKKKRRGLLGFLSYPDIFSKKAEEEAEEQEEEEKIIEPEDALPPVSLQDLSPEMREAAQRMGWEELLPVQSRAIPYLLAGRDLMVQSRTGSGKTGAFLLPMLQRLDPGLLQCQALVLVPTRELAQQVVREAAKISGVKGLRSVCVYGGVAYGPQLQALKEGVQIVVGTPGRILDLLLRRALSLSSLRMLVFDEADRLLSMGFYPDMQRIKAFLPDHKMNAYLFSATFPLFVHKLAGEFLSEPAFLSLSRDKVHVADIQHVYYVVPAMEKDRCLIRIIEIENPSSAFIFCNTKSRVSYVATVLKRFGYEAEELSSELSQSERDHVMGRVRSGRLRFLVATDIAGRGIDVPELSHVFVYEVPEDPEVYIHRTGRTGRAGAGGTAVSLVSGIEEVELKAIADRYGIALQQRPLPTEKDVAAVVAERLVAYLEARVRDRDSLKRERMERFIPLAASLSESEEGRALIAMLLDDCYQETLQTPPHQKEQGDVKEAPRPRPSRPARRKRRRRRRPKRGS